MIESPRQDIYLLSQLEVYRRKVPSRLSLHRLRCYEATGQVNWLKNFMPGLKVVDDIHKPLKLYCDNNPAVCYAHNNKSSGAAKHIDIKYYVVKDWILGSAP